MGIKASAARCGLSEVEYLSRLDAGELWCTGCKAFHPADSFGRDRNRASGKAGICREHAAGVRRANRERDRAYFKRRYALKVKGKPPDRTTVPIDAIGDLDIAYLAGLIDGEGCLTISIARPPGKIQHQPLLSIIMTHRGVIDWVAAIVGMPESTEIRKPKKSNRVTQYRVQLSGKRAIRLAERCLPHLKVKRAHAEVFLEFRKTYIKQGGPGVRVPPEVIERRDALRAELKRLNIRGIKALNIQAIENRNDVC